MSQSAQPNADSVVKDFLHGQNLEQVGKVDEAIPLYERAVEAAFDAAGPYDRLVHIYMERRAYTDAIRVAEASLRNVRTYPAKQNWYRERIEEARKELEGLPKPAPR